jgi:hypothetical protein
MTMTTTTSSAAPSGIRYEIIISEGWITLR